MGGFGTLLVPFLLRKLKTYMGTFASVMIVIAAIIYTIPNTFTILIGYAFIYWSSMIASVACSTRNTTMIPLHRMAFAQAILTTLLYLGQFLSTIVANAIASMRGVPVTDRSVVYCMLIPIIVMALIGLPRRNKSEA